MTITTAQVITNLRDKELIPRSQNGKYITENETLLELLAFNAKSKVVEKMRLSVRFVQDRYVGSCDFWIVRRHARP